MREPRSPERLRELEIGLTELSARVARLEEKVLLPAAPSERPELTASVSRALPARSIEVAGVAALVGRSAIVLGGAFLLRALTESAWLSRGAGTAVGLAYAAAWLVAADRAAARGRRASGVFHGAAALAIALPLIVEAATRFAIFTATSAAVALALLTASGFAIASARRLSGLWTMTSLGVITTALVLAFVTGAAAQSAAALVVLVAFTSWSARNHGMGASSWPAAAPVDLIVLFLILRESGRSGASLGPAVFILSVALFVASYSPMAWRTVVRRERIAAIDVVQTAVAVTLTTVAARLLATVGLQRVLGAAMIVLGLLQYGARFRRQQHPPTVFVESHFHSSLALAFTVIGAGLLLPRGLFEVVAGLGAIGMILASRRLSQPSLAAHAVVWLAGLTISSGWLSAMLTAWTSRIEHWPSPSAAMWAAAIAPAIAFVMTRSSDADHVTPGQRAVNLILLAFTVAGGGTLMLIGAGRWSLVDGVCDPARVAITRASVLSAGALAAALASRTPALRGAAPLVYPILAIGGLQLAANVLGGFTPMTMFVSLAMYGVALALAPRLRR